MNTLNDILKARLQERHENGTYRRLKSSTGIDFYSNDYLGIAHNLLLSTTFHLGTGSTGSRLISGNSQATELLEQKIAAFHKAEAALLFNSGYDANTGLVAAIANRHSVILYDELAHASIIDGTRLAQTDKVFKFRHNDCTDLELKLKRHATPGQNLIVITESVFSMDGDLAPLKSIATICEQYNAALIVDEAHATGIFGPRGEGLVVAEALQEKVFARVHTFGKAMGCQGAAVIGSSLLRDYLINFARTFIYTTAQPPVVQRFVDAAYTYLQSDSFNPQAIHDKIALFHRLTKNTPGWVATPSTIQVFQRPQEMSLPAFFNVSEQLKNAGFLLNAIVSPTVPEGKERLRCCIHTFNTEQEMTEMLEVLKRTL